MVNVRNVLTSKGVEVYFDDHPKSVATLPPEGGSFDLQRLEPGQGRHQVRVGATSLAFNIREGRAERGILLCGSGVGASVAASKFPGIRAALCHDTFSARQGVEDDDMNVLCLGARVIGTALAGEIVQAFLRASFSGADRHKRRLAKIQDFERRA